MPKYINTDELLKTLPDDLPYKASVKRVLIQAPEADVAPRSEVDRLVAELEEKSNRLREILPIVAEIKAEVAREIFEEIEENAQVLTVDGDFLINVYAYNSIKEKHITK